jgi:hypothetical protein
MNVYRHTHVGYWVLTEKGYESYRLRERYLNFEGRYLPRFERTCCFRKVGNRIQGYTVTPWKQYTQSADLHTAAARRRKGAESIRIISIINFNNTIE